MPNPRIDPIDVGGMSMVQTIDGNWLPMEDCTYNDSLDAWEESDDDDYPSWFKDYIDDKYGEDDTPSIDLENEESLLANGVQGSSQPGNGATGYNYNQQHNYNQTGAGWSGSTSCPHEGIALDVAFKLRGLTFAGSKAANVKSVPDFILDFSDSSWVAKDQEFMKDIKLASTVPTEVKDRLKKLEGFTQPPLAIMTFKWADQGAPIATLDFWTELIPTMEELLLEYRQRKTGSIVLCCMGGHGRTGTGMASILVACGGYRVGQAVQMIRDDYCESAVESQKQIDYLYDLEKAAAEKFTAGERAKMRAGVSRPNADYVIRKKESKAADKATKDAEDAAKAATKSAATAEESKVIVVPGATGSPGGTGTGASSAPASGGGGTPLQGGDTGTQASGPSSTKSQGGTQGQAPLLKTTAEKSIEAGPSKGGAGSSPAPFRPEHEWLV